MTPEPLPAANLATNLIDVRDIMRQVRERVRGADTEEEWQRQGRKSVPQRLVGSVSRLRASTATLRSAIARIGAPPPAPATLRGHLGQSGVALIRRALFWLIPSIQASQMQIVDALEQHIAATEEILNALRQTNAELARLDQGHQSAPGRPASGSESAFARRARAS